MLTTVALAATAFSPVPQPPNGAAAFDRRAVLTGGLFGAFAAVSPLVRLMAFLSC